MIPELNKTYNFFNDGKIRESRLHKAKITEVIPFKEIDEETLSNWKIEVEQCPWLYAEETDYFVRADVAICDGEEQFFVRTKDNGWFSIGFLSMGRLDITGELTEILKK